MKFRSLLFASLATTLLPLLRAQDGSGGAAAAPAESRTRAAAALPKLPWHMTNIWWQTAGEIADFHSFSVDVDLSTDMPSETYNLYISPFGGMSINDNSVYGGIQTNCNGWNAMAPGDQIRRHGGKGFIFSRWSEKPTLTLDDVRATPGGFVESAGYEGYFVSGRRPYPWTAGAYTFTLLRLDTEIHEGDPYTWVGAFVREHATGKEIFVSALRFAGEQLKHNGRNACFIEFYATSQNSRAPEIAKLPPLEVRFSNLRFNGQPAQLTHVSANFIREASQRPDGLDAPISPNIMRVSASEDGREVTCRLLNQPVTDAEEPSRVLWQLAK